MESGGTLVSDEEWATVVRRCVGDAADFKIVCVEWGEKSEEIKGFLGSHLTVKVSVLQDGQNEHKQLDFFVKTIPKGSEFAERLIANNNAFDRETTVFSTIFEEFKKYELMFKKEGRVKWAPECYLTRPDLLIMENLITSGFRLYNTLECLDFDHCTLVIAALARFHASSVVYEEKERIKTGNMKSLMEMYPDILSDVFSIRTDGSENLFRDSCYTTFSYLPSLIKQLEKYNEQSEHYTTILEHLKPKLGMALDLAPPSTKYRNVICHGDLWTNNMLFRYGESNTPEEVRLVDFQIVRYCPPAADVFFFLHQATDREFRRKNLETLLSIYYEEFSSVLQQHQVDNSVLTWEEFRESCELYAHVGRVMAPIYHTGLLMPNEMLQEAVSTSENFEDFVIGDRSASILNCFKKFPNYRKRISDDLEELIERTILEKN